MKKFVSGIIVGVLLFASTTVFAETAKSLLGKKVQGTYEVTFNGKPISDAAVIEGSTYLPVRSVSDAAGIDISVEGRKINLTTSQSTPDTSDTDVDKSNKAKGEIEGKIGTLQEQISLYQQKINTEKKEVLEPLEKRLVEIKDEEYTSALGPELSKQGIEIVEGKIAESKKLIKEFEAKIDAAEAEIKEMEAKLNNK